MSKSLTTTKKKFPPVHPGELLKQDLEDIDVSMNALARAISVPSGRIVQIVNGKRGISAETALRLGFYFGTSAEYWMNLQKKYELETAQDQMATRIQREVLPRTA
jgi:addiction module HigA family antidote